MDTLTGEVTGITGSLTGTIDGLNGTINDLTGNITGQISGITGSVNGLLEEITRQVEGLKPIVANVEALSAKVNEPDGLLYTVLDTNEPVYTNLVEVLGSVSGILSSLDKTSAFLPSQMPQITALLSDLRSTLKTAEEVLTALTNNPLLKKGVPVRLESQSGGTGMRNVEF